MEHRRVQGGALGTGLCPDNPLVTKSRGSIVNPVHVMRQPGAWTFGGADGGERRYGKVKKIGRRDRQPR